MSEKQSRKTEKEAAGSSYIIEFYQTIQLMTHEHANYINTLVFLQNKYGNLQDNGMEAQDDQDLKVRVQILRHSFIKGYLMLNSLKNILKINEEEKEEENIKSLYDKVRKDFIIKNEDSENFVIKMNDYLLSEILNSLIKTSQDFLNKMYDDNKTE